VSRSWFILGPVRTGAQPYPHHSLPGDPWFRKRPHVTVAVAGVLFLAVFTVRLLAGSPVDAYSMFYVLPVALAGATFGRRGGVAAALVACALIVAWTLRADVSLTPSGWASRVVPILLLGVLLGHAADRAARAESAGPAAC